MAVQGYNLEQTGPQVQEALDKIIGLSPATTETAGTMSATDKAKLDALPSGADLTAALSGKVDKETGKGLSTNDFTNSNKEAVEQSLPLGVQTALDRTQDMDTVRSGAAAGATAYQKPQTGIPASDLASGVIPTALSELSEDTTHRTVTDSEKNAWNETNIIHASVLAFPAAFSNYTREQALAAFGVTNEQFGLIIASVGVYRTLMGGATMAFTNGVFIQSWDAGGITFRRLTFSTIGSEVVYSFSGPLYLANVQSDWNEDDSTKPSFIKHKPDLSMKADKVSSPTAGNFAGLDSYGNLTDSGSKAGDFQPTIDNNHKLDYGLLSNTPTIPDAQIQSDWNQSDNTKKDYIKNKPSIPAAQVNSDWNANSGVAQILNKPSIPDAVEANPTVPAGTTPSDLTGLKVGNGYYGIPVLPSVDNTPTANSNNLVKSGGVYAAINPPIVTTQPVGGFEPGKKYRLGTLTGIVTFALANPTDNNIPNVYWINFDTGSTEPTITWPLNVVWPKGTTAPVVGANEHYEVKVEDGYITYNVFDIPSA